MTQKQIETAYEKMLEAIQILENALKSGFLEAYIENGENMLEDFKVQVTDGIPNETDQAALHDLYLAIKDLNEKLSRAEKLKVLELLLLRGSKEDHLQPNHQLTPDALGFLFVFFIEQFYPKGPVRILDGTVGMGNLLLTVLIHLNAAGWKPFGIGVENDDALIEIAAINSELTAAPVQFYHQDALQPLLEDAVDVAIADLPVGYYPQNETAEKFAVAAPDDVHTYAHHILMEALMKQVKPGGFGIFLVPANLFESRQTKNLNRWLKKTVYLQGMIQLPERMFASKSSQKSILILQQPGENVQQAGEVLLAKLPSLKDPAKMQEFFAAFHTWKTENLS